MGTKWSRVRIYYKGKIRVLRTQIIPGEKDVTASAAMKIRLGSETVSIRLVPPDSLLASPVRVYHDGQVYAVAWGDVLLFEESVTTSDGTSPWKYCNDITCSCDTQCTCYTVCTCNWQCYDDQGCSCDSEAPEYSCSCDVEGCICDNQCTCDADCPAVCTSHCVCDTVGCECDYQDIECTCDVACQCDYQACECYTVCTCYPT